MFWVKIERKLHTSHDEVRKFAITSGRIILGLNRVLVKKRVVKKVQWMSSTFLPESCRLREMRPDQKQREIWWSKYKVSQK